MNISRKTKYQNLTKEEQNLLNLYLNEYEEMFQFILIQSQKEFMENIIKRVELTLKKKINDIPLIYKKHVEQFLIDQIYIKEYIIISNCLKSIKHNLNDSSFFFNGKIIEHCENDKKNGFYIHSCGNKFYSSNYIQDINFENLNDNTQKKKSTFLICLHCNMIYKSNLIKFHCNEKNIDFYSKIINDGNIKDFPYATWKKYHCNAVINDTMKCPICKKSLLYDKENDKLICRKCNKSVNPKKITWKCLICKKDFISEAKEYNHLEYKNMKICIKNILINKKKAKPEKLICSCDLNIDSTIFYHKPKCSGELFIGEMDNKKIIVCNKCDSLGYFDNFIWTCPHCQKRFRLKKNESDKIQIKENQNNKLKNNYEIIYRSGIKMRSPILKKGRCESSSPEENKNNQRIWRSSNKKFLINYLRNNNSKSDILSNQRIGSRSPLQVLRNGLNHNIKNLQIDFDNCILKEEDEKIENDEIQFTKTESNLFNMIMGNNNNLREKSNEKKEISKEKKEISPIKNHFRKKRNIISSNKISVSTLENSMSERDKEEKEKEKKVEILEKEKNKILEKKIQLKEKEYDISEYDIKEQIGHGSFGQIFKVISPDGKIYAMKKIMTSNKEDIEDVQHEYNILKELKKCSKQYNLINIYNMQTKQLDPTTFVLYVIMDLATSDWEKEVLKRGEKKDFYDERELIKILKSLIKTFAQLQRINISHRDIKPQNVLFFKENNTYKLSDFGEAKELISNKEVTAKRTLRGSELYMSPLLFKAMRNKRVYITEVKHNIFKSDVYSFGLMSFFAASLSYESLYDIRELNSNFSVRVVLEKYLKRHYSPIFIDLIATMLDVDEKSRIDFLDLEKIIEEYEY